MSGFIDEADRNQSTLLPERVEEYVSEENPVRVIDAFIGELDLAKFGFEGMKPKPTGRSGYHPATMLKIYLYGYLNRIQSSRRLEQEARRNLELIWLVGRLAPHSLRGTLGMSVDTHAQGNNRPLSRGPGLRF